jgi:two-component system response regulator DesR
MARTVRPDVAIVDIDLLTDDGLATVRRLNETGCAVLVIAGSEAPGVLRRALNVHVRGFIGKHAAPSQLAQTIRKVAGGERVIDASLAVAVVAAPSNPLSPRERDVLSAASSGVPSDEVAAALHLTAGTVRNYISAILRKTGARNRLEAIRMAEEAGWLC